MTYQVLARKWRPQDFSSLVGQEHIVTALRNGLTEGRIAQAYLFAGIRGVGKTTAARVLAKALNCQKGPAADPCNECPACSDIGEGKSLDVLEIDAATYSKVEQVRELTESLRYGPANCRYKVVVLDEVHRLSRQAFDALLKIVEEPPAHLVFLFATTEIDAVPATILSRCQEYQFRRVPSGILSGHLRKICEAEGIEASDAALRMIAKAGEGSVRDSVALLDQMATFGNNHIHDEDAQALFGGLDTSIFRDLLSAILEGDSPVIVEQVRTIDANGWDPNNVFRQFLSYARDALHLAMGGAAQSVDLPEEEAETLRERVRPHGYEPLLQILSLLLSSEASLRRSEIGILALEIAWLRAAELPKVVRIQEILSGQASPTDGGNGSSGQDPKNGKTARAEGEGRPGSRADASAGSQDPFPPHDPLPVDGAKSDAESALPTGAGPTSGSSGTSEAPNALSSSSFPTPSVDLPPPSDASTPAERFAAAAPPESERLIARDETSSLDPAVPEAHVETARRDAGETDRASSEPLDPTRLSALMEILGSQSQSLAALLTSARLETEGPRLLIRPDAGDRHLRKALERQRNVASLEQACRKAWGREVSWQVGDGPPRGDEPAPARARGEHGSATRSRDAEGSVGDGAVGDRSAGPPPAPADPAPYEPGGFWPEGPEVHELLPPYPSGRGSAEIPREDLDDVAALPVVSQVMKMFSGRIESIRPEAPDRESRR